MGKGEIVESTSKDDGEEGDGDETSDEDSVPSPSNENAAMMDNAREQDPAKIRSNHPSGGAHVASGSTPSYRRREKVWYCVSLPA